MQSKNICALKGICLIFISCYASVNVLAQSPQKNLEVPSQQEQLKNELNEALTKGLLQLWYPRAIDEEMGGFYSSFAYDWKLGENQNKMIVTQARHVWTTAKAALLFPENILYKKTAEHGFRFLKDKMWDNTYGGFHDLVNRQGNPMEKGVYGEYKRTYGNAFAIYGLSAYYALSKDEEALALAQKTFLWLEENAHDAVYGGYFPSLTIEGKAVLDNPDEKILNNIGVLYKDQNTSIHLLEAFTELYKVWPDVRVATRLKEMLTLVRDTIAAKPGYLRLFFYRDWTPVSLRDSSETVRKAHYDIDHISFGHDIETAFLLLEASYALGKFELEKTMSIAKMMVDHTMANGFDPAYGGIYEQGYYFKESDSITIIDNRKNWWAQAEGLNALWLFSELYPEEKNISNNL